MRSRSALSEDGVSPLPGQLIYSGEIEMVQDFTYVFGLQIVV